MKIKNYTISFCNPIKIKKVERINRNILTAMDRLVDNKCRLDDDNPIRMKQKNIRRLVRYLDCFVGSPLGGQRIINKNFPMYEGREIRRI